MQTVYLSYKFILFYILSTEKYQDTNKKIGIKREYPEDPDNSEQDDLTEGEVTTKRQKIESKEEKIAPKANSEPILSSHTMRNGTANGVDYNMLLLRHGIDSFNRRNAVHNPQSPIEVLVKIFPTLRRYILELILKGCDNDIVNAIECILATNHQSPQHRNETQVSRAQEVPFHYQVPRQQIIPPNDTMATTSTYPNMDIISRPRGLARAHMYGPASRFSSVITKCTFSTPPHIPTLPFDRVRKNCTSPENRSCLKCGNGEAVCCSSAEPVRHYKQSWI